jgi:hypothetical protein
MAELPIACGGGGLVVDDRVGDGLGVEDASATAVGDTEGGTTVGEADEVACLEYVEVLVEETAAVGLLVCVGENVGVGVCDTLLVGLALSGAVSVCELEGVVDEDEVVVTL